MNKEQLKKAFSDAIAWGFVYGPALSAQDFNELRDKKAEQLVENFSNLIKDAERYSFIKLNSYVELHCDSPRQEGWSPELFNSLVDKAKDNA